MSGWLGGGWGDYSGSPGQDLKGYGRGEEAGTQTYEAEPERR